MDSITSSNRGSTTSYDQYISARGSTPTGRAPPIQIDDSSVSNTRKSLNATTPTGGNVTPNTIFSNIRSKTLGAEPSSPNRGRAIRDVVNQVQGSAAKQLVTEAEAYRSAGVGVFFTSALGSFVVSSVTEGGSADRSHLIQPRDVLTSVDGQSVELWTLETVKKAIVGDYGSYVTLGFNRESPNGLSQYFEARLIRATPAWLILNDKYEALQKQFLALKDELGNLRHSLANTEAENAQLSLEAERLRAMIKMSEEQLQKLRTQLAEESRRSRTAEGRLDTLETNARLDADEIGRLRKSVADFEGELKLAKAVAEEYKEKSEQESGLRKVEAHRRSQAEAREQEAQVQLAAAHEIRHQTEVKLDVSDRENGELKDRLRVLGEELQNERERRESAMARARAAEEDRLQAHGKIESLGTELVGLENMRKADAGLIAQLQGELSDLSSRLNSVSTELSAELREHRQTTDHLRQSQLHAQADAEEISRLSTKVETSNSEISHLKIALTAAQRSLTESESREHDLGTQINKYVADIRRLESVVAASSHDLSNVRDQLSQVESALQAEKGSVFQANDKIRNLEDVRRQNQDEITRSRQQAESLNAEVDRLKRELSDVNGQRQALGNQVSLLEQASQRIQQEVHTLTEQLDNTNANLKRSEAVVDAQRKSISEFEGQIASLKSLSEGLERQLISERHERSVVENALKESERRVEAHLKTITELNGEASNLKSHIENVDRQLVAERGEKVSLQSHIRDVEHKEQQEQVRNRDLTAQVAGLRQDLLAAKATIDDQNGIISKKQSEIEEALRKVANTEHREQLEQLRNRDLAAQGAQLRSDLQAVKQGADEISASLSQKQIECDDVSRRALNVQKSLTAAEEQIQQLQDALRGVQGELVSMLAEKNRQIDAKEHATKLKDQALHDLAAANSKIEGLEERLKGVSSDLETTKRALRDEQATSSKRLSDLEGAIALEQKLRKQLEDLVSSNTTTKFELDDTRRRLKDAESLLAKRTQDYENALAKEAAIRKQFDDLQSNTTAAKHELDELRRRVAELEGVIARRNQDLDAALANGEKVKRLLDEEIGKTVAAKVKIDTLIHTINELEAQLKVNDITRQKLEALYGRLRQMEEETARANDNAKAAREELAAYYRLPDPCGVGMQVESDGSEVVIKSIIPDMSAAYSQILLPGDFILAIDGKPVSQMAIGDVRSLIAGRRGSYVTFRLSRDGGEFEAKIKRGSFGPEFHVVGSEPLDGSNPGHPAEIPSIPEKRNSK